MFDRETNNQLTIYDSDNKNRYNKNNNISKEDQHNNKEIILNIMRLKYKEKKQILSELIIEYKKTEQIYPLHKKNNTIFK